MNLNIFIQHFINALSLGSLYGLVAVGYTMVYGILRLINFAHGDIFMLGAYFVYFAT
ncbi:MAG: branched-chain amino acid ABC transporter permease, partial [Synergistaceae bacterium]|nr:branched-chain amino acid ABC transporter permease [Synergistaceae bacterium]